MFPTLFISHGAPTTALDGGLAAQAWRALGEQLFSRHGKPRAVVVVSPHTVAGGQAALVPPLDGSTGHRLKAWHDFYGFPAELYELQYSPPGEPEVAQTLAAGLSQAGIPTALAERAEIDHGVWVPLRSLFPAADVPVVQLAMSREWVRPTESGTGAPDAANNLPQASGAGHAARVGAALAALRERGELDGVLILGSGSLTHNLRHFDRSAAENEVTRPYVQPFRQGLAALMGGGAAGDEPTDAKAPNERLGALEGAARWHSLPGAADAHPSDEHLLPLFFAWAAAGPGARARLQHQSTLGGAFAMDLWAFEPLAET